MSNIQITPELLEALKAAGLQVAPARKSVKEMSETEKAQEMVKLEAELELAKANKDLAEAKRLRRMQRTIMGGPWRRQYSKIMLPQAE